MEQLEAHELRLFHDKYAFSLLTPEMKFFVALCRFKWFRNWIISTSEKAMPGAYAGILCRKLYFDRKAQANASAVSAMIDIGAGYDSRSLRLCSKCNVPFYELDYPETMKKKEAMIKRAAPSLSERIRFVGIDLDKEKIGENRVLRAELLKSDGPRFFFLEAVTPYLTKEGIEELFQFLGDAPKGSFLAFTYIDQAFIDGTDLMHWDAVYKKYVKNKVWKFGLTKESAATFLAGYGWTLLEDVTADEVASKEILRKRNLATSKVERFVFAQK